MSTDFKYYLEKVYIQKDDKSFLNIKGWAFAKTELMSIQVYIDGSELVNHNIETLREDVFNQFKVKNSLKSGFEISILLDPSYNKNKNLKIYLACSDKKIEILNKPLNKIEVSVTNQIQPILYHIDELKFDDEELIIDIRGWVFSTKTENNVKIQVYLDKSLIGEFSTTKLRYDVSKAFPKYKQAQRSGFNKMINLDKYGGNITVKFIDSEKNIEAFKFHINSKEKKRVLERIILAIKVIDYIVKKAWNVLKKNNFKISLKDLKKYYKKSVSYYKQRFNSLDISKLLRVRDPYEVWLDNNKLTSQLSSILKNEISMFKYDPSIGIILLNRNNDLEAIEKSITSIKKQTYDNWKMNIVTSCDIFSDLGCIRKTIDDERINIDNMYNFNSLNNVVESFNCDYIMILNQGDFLNSNTLFDVVRFLQKDQADLIYFDEDEENKRNPEFKPDWSPELLLSYNYINNAYIVKKKALQKVEGFNIKFDELFNYDFLLRLTEYTDKILHIPKILLHTKQRSLSEGKKRELSELGKIILEQAIKRRNIEANIEIENFLVNEKNCVYSLDFPDYGPEVTIIIPNKNKYEILKNCIDSLKRTTYKNFKILVIDNDSDDIETLNYLSSISNEHEIIKISNEEGKGFSYSYINNKAVIKSNTEYILFLNNDTEVINPKWLSSMVGYLKITEVGAVGARLIFPDERIQHAGIVMGLNNGLAAPAFKLVSKENLGYLAYSKVARNYSAVTAACLLVRRDDFINVEMFDEENFAVAYNDLDLCMKILQRLNKRIVYVPKAELFHYEGATRGYIDNIDEVLCFREKYKNYQDRYYNINLSKDNEQFEIKTDNTFDYEDILVHNKPKILMVTHNLNFEGAPLQLFEVAKGLAKRGNVAIEFCSPKDGPLKEVIEKSGFKVYIKPIILTEGLDIKEYKNSIKELSEWIIRCGFDILYANTLETFPYIGSAQISKTKVIWNIHESAEYNTYFKYLPIDIQNEFIKSFEYAYKVIFVANSTLELYKVLNVNKSFTYIHNALIMDDINEYKKKYSKVKIKDKLGLKHDTNLVLILGTTCERKGQLDFVKSVKKVVGKGEKNTVFYIVGGRTGAYLEKIQDYIEENNLEKYVKVIMETNEVNQYYIAADVFVCASYNESFPRVILEAMAFEIPIITTPVYGISEQVIEKVNALVFDPGDINKLASNLLELLRDKELRSKFSENSLKVLKLINSYDEMILRYEEIIKKAWMSDYKGNAE